MGGFGWGAKKFMFKKFMCCFHPLPSLDLVWTRFGHEIPLFRLTSGQTLGSSQTWLFQTWLFVVFTWKHERVFPDHPFQVGVKTKDSNSKHQGCSYPSEPQKTLWKNEKALSPENTQNTKNCPWLKRPRKIRTPRKGRSGQIWSLKIVFVVKL